MEERELEHLLRQVREGSLPVEEAMAHLRTEPFENLGYARVDHHRSIRQGAGEVLFGQGKTAEQIGGIVEALAAKGACNILITRMDEKKAAALEGRFPLRYDPVPHLGVAYPREIPLVGSVVVASGGTSVVGGLVDCPVIAVPTSVGYGANFGGLSALLSMLNGCASGVSVVNIDNGFGAGFLANRINQMKGVEA